MLPVPTAQLIRQAGDQLASRRRMTVWGHSGTSDNDRALSLSGTPQVRLKMENACENSCSHIIDYFEAGRLCD